MVRREVAFILGGYFYEFSSILEKLALGEGATTIAFELTVGFSLAFNFVSLSSVELSMASIGYV